jgi:hypothetical protein
VARISLTCWPRSTGSDQLMHKVSAHSRREFKARSGNARCRCMPPNANERDFLAVLRYRPSDAAQPKSLPLGQGGRPESAVVRSSTDVHHPLVPSLSMSILHDGMRLVRLTLMPLADREELIRITCAVFSYPFISHITSVPINQLP